MPYVLTISGIILFAICVYVLITHVLKRRIIYDADIISMPIDIPKPGKYTIQIRRRNHGPFNWHSNTPSYNFTIHENDNEIEYHPAIGIRVNIIGTGHTTQRTGYFRAPYPGQYQITSQPDSRIIEHDKIIILRHTHTIKLLLPTIGLAVAPFMFTDGLAGGVLSLVGAVAGAVLILANH